MTPGAWQIDPRTIWFQNASSFSCPGSFLCSFVPRRGWETGKAKGTRSRFTCTQARLMAQVRPPCLAFSSPSPPLRSHRAAKLPQVLECGSGGVVGCGCWACACITAVSASMGPDWQGPGQHQRLENALESKSIEVLDGELLI